MHRVCSDWLADGRASTWASVKQAWEPWTKETVVASRSGTEWKSMLLRKCASALIASGLGTSYSPALEHKCRRTCNPFSCNQAHAATMTSTLRPNCGSASASDPSIGRTSCTLGSLFPCSKECGLKYSYAKRLLGCFQLCDAHWPWKKHSPTL